MMKTTFVTRTNPIQRKILVFIADVQKRTRIIHTYLLFQGVSILCTHLVLTFVMPRYSNHFCELFLLQPDILQYNFYFLKYDPQSSLEQTVSAIGRLQATTCLVQKATSLINHWFFRTRFSVNRWHFFQKGWDRFSLFR